ncbi:hypothetical protein Ep4_009 [Pseudomonas phage Ep4]|uniref:Uncharacterized protein n=1 Tax=Pseudomonas phage Ep4 TaxID=3057492 RepID=A0AAU9EQK6_9CAUD|nr:hypothetical protein Ep4_009 [Pseudomonas phage Ep4]
MSALSKVASFILLLDQKYHAASAYVHHAVADKAYRAAEKAYKAKSLKAMRVEQDAQKQAIARRDKIRLDTDIALANVARAERAAVNRADQMLVQADTTRDRYEQVASVAFSAALSKEDAVANHSTIRASL